MPAVQRASLLVEGDDDAHAIKHLLRQYGCICPIKDDKRRENWSENAPMITPVGDVDSLLDGMPSRIKLSNGRSVGFVLDADEVAGDRWRDVCRYVANIGLPIPSQIPTDGYVDISSEYHTRVGVWLMPDNRHSGALEAFLKDLVDNNDQLLSVAEDSTEKARKAGARFPDTKQDKAVIRTWLAWQEEPGLPYGLAVSKHYFAHNTALAGTFVGWFKRVFDCG